MHGHRLERVRRAGGVVAADLAVERADQRSGRPAAGRSGRTSSRSAPAARLRGNASRSAPSSPYDAPRRRPAAPGPRARAEPGSDVEALPGQVAEPALHPVADDGVAHRLADHEADPRAGRPASVAVDRRQVDDQGARRRRGGPGGPRARKLAASTSAGAAGQHEHAHGVGPRPSDGEAACGPCGGARTGWRDPARVRIRRRKPCTL